MRYLLTLVALLGLALLSKAQPSSTNHLIYVTAAPSGACSASAALQYVISGGDVGKLYGCGPGGVWSLKAGTGAGAVTCGSTPGQLCYNNAGAFGGITGATTDGTAVTLVAPVLGTPASGTLTNTTGLPAAGVVAGALANGMTGTTQTAGDNSTKIATTAYADAEKITTQSVNLVGSRAFDTAYQNTGTKPMFVATTANNGATGLTDFRTDSSNPPTTVVHYGTYNASSAAATFGVVLPGNYYLLHNGVASGGAGAVLTWFEWK